MYGRSPNGFCWKIGLLDNALQPVLMTGLPGADCLPLQEVIMSPRRL